MTRQHLPTTKPGLLLVGHGTRNERGVAEFLETASLVAPLLPEVAVEPAFLELAEPSIGAALERLAKRGVRDIVVVPLLLFTAGHAKQDIPNEIATAAASFPHLQIRQSEALGCHENLLAASAERFHKALPPDTFNPVTDVAWLLVSRGSSDSSAIEAVRGFVQLRHKSTPVASASLGFMAVAEPPIEAALETLARSSYPCVVVQPHLLFQGKLTEDLRVMVHRKQAESPAKTWLVADHLGPCNLVAEAAVTRFWEALAVVR